MASIDCGPCLFACVDPYLLWVMFFACAFSGVATQEGLVMLYLAKILFIKNECKGPSTFRFRLSSRHLAVMGGGGAAQSRDYLPFQDET